MENGTLTTGGQKMTITNTQSLHNADNGIVAFSTGAATEIAVDSSNVFDNSGGVASNGSGAVIYLSKSTVSGNTTGIDQIDGSSIVSYGNNSLSSNGSNTTFSTTSTQ